jgi:DNA-binding transcriptional ArsR family regulator
MCVEELEWGAMRPLVHPAIEEVTVEAILHALSDPVRVAIFAEIVGQECTQKCSSFVPVGGEAIPKSTLSQHFRILREAGLIRGERRGVEMHNVSRYVEVDQMYPGLLAAIGQAHTLQVGRAAKAAKKSGKKTK